MAELEIVQIKEEMERLEEVISRNQQSFYEIGIALAEIRDKKLYRDVAGFATFEEYCKRKWDFSGNYARRLIASSAATDNIKNVPMGTFPTVERQVRPLTKLEPDQQVIAWQKAIDITPPGKNPTAALVTRIVKQMNKKEDVMEETPKPKYNGKRVYDMIACSDAEAIVDMAISQLQRIRNDDPLKTKALERLEQWIVKDKNKN